MSSRACLCFLLRPSPAGPEVLLGQKKRGFGAGKIVGPGGHIEPGETALAAAVRETREETGIVLAPDAVRAGAVVVFRFPSRPTWNMTVAVFVARAPESEPVESDELAPRWYAVSDLPFDAMWEDDRHWLSRVLDGERLRAHITYDAAGERVSAIRIRPMNGATPA